MARPVVHCLIAYPLKSGHVILSMQDRVTLDEAVDYHRLGFIVLVDPEDEADLAEYERECRLPPAKRRSRWWS